MAGRNRQPLSVIQGKGKSKHITKEEAKKRQQQEEQLSGYTDKIEAPSYLTKKQKEDFEHLSTELMRLGIFSNLDVDNLARYIDSKTHYLELNRELKKIKPTEVIELDDGSKRTVHNKDYPALMRVKNNLFNECRAAASDLGLSITSRLKLVIPKAEDDKPKTEAEKRFSGRL
ncbi:MULTISPECIES: phage terminase small subunit P27 family [unclassified Oceanobacillus]|uniref:phage terminase small subunit P27 family n=1 Tax=unclassified Oceanobacillus TaxID=2630292 RepID=UPI001BEB27D7|nr:phage terminase small subunit P27 family [Oceanobacillus sp. ISL-74]MBT2653593.1 phage terminase small subunit P27 family [Oceanobacillus sp. ISL-73]